MKTFEDLVNELTPKSTDSNTTVDLSVTQIALAEARSKQAEAKQKKMGELLLEIVHRTDSLEKSAMDNMKSAQNSYRVSVGRLKAIQATKALMNGKSGNFLPAAKLVSMTHAVADLFNLDMSDKETQALFEFPDKMETEEKA